MKALVAIDDSEPSWKAAEFAGRLLRDEDDVLVLNVATAKVPMMFAAGGLSGFPVAYVDEELPQDTPENIAELLRPAAAAARSDEVVVEYGGVIERILEIAAEQEVDLIIVGTHDRGTFSRLLHGSVSDALVHDAPCPVLVVR